MIGRDNPYILPDPATSEPELVPINDFVTLTFADMQPQSIAPGDGPVLAGLIEDALFGEVIDISDLIPRVLSPAMDAPPPQSVADAAETGFFGQDAGDIAAAAGHGALTILYDDDILALDGTIL